MKFLKTSFPAMLLVLFTAGIFVSCDKDDDVIVQPPSIIGHWKGKYSSSSTTYPTLAYQFLFRSNGTVRVYDGADTASAGKAEGTYTLTGSVLAATYTYLGGGSTFSTAATVNSSFTFIEGTWGNGTNTTDGGLFFVVKQ